MKTKYLCTFILFVVLLSIMQMCFADEMEYEALNLKAKVISASEEKDYSDGYTTYIVQNVKVEILEKRFKGQQFDVIYYLEDGINSRLPLYEKCKVGDTVYVYGLYEDGKLSVEGLAFYDKTFWIITICIIYAVLILVIGGKKGVQALLSLIITVLLIFGILIPNVLDGKEPISCTILICSITIILTFLIVSGISKKTLVAALRNYCGSCCCRNNRCFFLV